LTNRVADFLDLTSVTRAELEWIFRRSGDWKDGVAAPPEGRLRVATVFNSPAFRTRLAFDSAIDNMGAHRVDLPLTLAQREPIADTAAILSSAVDAVVIRHSDHDQVLELAQHSEVPVVNAMTSVGHPCEIISEAFTLLQRRGTLDGLSVTFVGEATNLFRSWCELATQFDISVTQVAPDGYAAPPDFLEAISARGGKLTITTDLASGAVGASVLYTDGWPRQACQPGTARDAFLGVQVTTSTLDLMAPGGVLMHCMPVSRGDEVTAEAFADPRSITLAAKTNLAPTHTAILEHVLALGCAHE
jgi:ornithine carbamoyltransferase